MYSYSYYHGPNPVVTVILFLIALVGGICVYLMFVKSDEEPKDPRLLKLKEFLSFKKMIIEGLLKATYIIFALFVTLSSFQIMIGTSFITGFMAKESVVSTLGILVGNNITSILSAASVYSLLTFALLYTPCVAAIASIKRELGVKWAIYVVVYQCAIAWLASFGVYRLVLLLI